MTRPRQLSIERIVVDGGAMTPDDAERLRVELARELARLLSDDAAKGIMHEHRARVAITSDFAAGERIHGAGIAGSIVQALSRP